MRENGQEVCVGEDEQESGIGEVNEHSGRHA